MILPSQMLRAKLRRSWLETALFVTLSAALAVWEHPYWSMSIAIIAALSLYGTLHIRRLYNSPFLYLVDLAAFCEEDKSV